VTEPKRPSGWCKDCWPLHQAAFFTLKQRPAPFPGPRCATHNRAKKKADKAKAQLRRDEQVYGLSEGGYDELLRLQGGVCALCQRSKGLSKRMPVDHDHATGAVRGIVCTNCNRNVLGWFARDDPAAFLRGIAYLENPPANLLHPAYLVKKED
jgi:hypothetical protein